MPSQIERASPASIHLGFGQLFAAFYGAGFAMFGRSGLWLGAMFGLAHAAVRARRARTAAAGAPPRMASERAGPDSTAVLEPPGFLALNYGMLTPW